METLGLDPRITICKIAVLPVKLCPLSFYNLSRAFYNPPGGRTQDVTVKALCLNRLTSGSLNVYPKNDLNVYDVLSINLKFILSTNSSIRTTMIFFIYAWFLSASPKSDFTHLSRINVETQIY
jgi:hypothetical protein